MFISVRRLLKFEHRFIMQYSEFSIPVKSNLGIFTNLQLLIEIGHNVKDLFKCETKEIRVFY